MPTKLGKPIVSGRLSRGDAHRSLSEGYLEGSNRKNWRSSYIGAREPERCCAPRSDASHLHSGGRDSGRIATRAPRSAASKGHHDTSAESDTGLAALGLTPPRVPARSTHS